MKTKTRIEFGRRLRYFRHEKELTQEKLGTLSGLHMGYISSVERGERNVSLENIWKLANALQISPVKFFQPVQVTL